MSILLAALLSLSSVQAFAQASCAPVSNEARILASADMSDIYPGWGDGSYIGLSWSLIPTGDEQGADGEFYLIGDLVDPRGNVVNEGVYVNAMQWECDAPD